MNYLAVGARHPTPPPKRVLNGSERIGRPVLRSARSGRGVERASREFASEEKSRPPPRKQRRMATRLYVQIVCSGSLFSSRVKLNLPAPPEVARGTGWVTHRYSDDMGSFAVLAVPDSQSW